MQVLKMFKVLLGHESWLSMWVGFPEWVMFTCESPPLYDSLSTDKSKHSDKQQALSWLLLFLQASGRSENPESKRSVISWQRRTRPWRWRWRCSEGTSGKPWMNERWLLKPWALISYGKILKSSKLRSDLESRYHEDLRRSAGLGIDRLRSSPGPELHHAGVWQPQSSPSGHRFVGHDLKHAWMWVKVRVKRAEMKDSGFNRFDLYWVIAHTFIHL